MFYTSTRKNLQVSSAMAIAKGLSDDGGLFVPESFPALDENLLTDLAAADYKGRASKILKLFLTDFTDEEIEECVTGAYEGKFENNIPAPLYLAGENLSVLELWHGPTCAFKDMALQLLPYLLTKSAKKVSGEKTMVILVATSGDTGKAALEGFKDVENTKIIVFYPEDGVSAMQKLQMTTQEGSNLSVCAIKGNFDDAQSGVKQIFSDEAMAARLEAGGFAFSSANSINFGRLVPQIIYYVSAYCDLVKGGKIRQGDFINVAVPTGNFGNILAAYYAKRMGLPIKKLICASNQNNILTDFLNTGVYDRNRDFYTTSSPSMDILISSNLERLLYELTGRDAEKVAELMGSLSETGRYEVDESVLSELKGLFAGGFCDDTATFETIKTTFETEHYLIDTHTAVAMKVYADYKAGTGDNTPAVVVSTASPYKFSNSVLKSLGGSNGLKNEFDMTDEIHKISGMEIPDSLAALKTKPVIYKGVCTKESMENVIVEFLGL